MNAGVKVSQADLRLAGIRGWLILPAIGMAVSPLLGVIGLVSGLEPLDNMVNQGFGVYAIPRLIVNIGLLIYTCVTAVRFFKKRRTAVRTVIKLLIARAVAFLVLFVIGVIVFGGDNEEIIITLFKSNNFIAQGIAAAVWISYFRVSKRVKATFVN
jgi:hypothetical protein